ncbi:hypothetical protein SACS_1041 [Parasaccharibacter apium]|uniref:Uncharacterized protein n=1 Tax=Parasaccharibacter apium TaxID=1510841 RepID=A0A7U7G635_9PROT|nr:hypothetical protein SACS_1041 [Parasaccharibacter apium]
MGSDEEETKTHNSSSPCSSTLEQTVSGGCLSSGIRLFRTYGRAERSPYPY